MPAEEDASTQRTAAREKLLRPLAAAGNPIGECRERCVCRGDHGAGIESIVQQVGRGAKRISDASRCVVRTGGRSRGAETHLAWGPAAQGVLRLLEITELWKSLNVSHHFETALATLRKDALDIRDEASRRSRSPIRAASAMSVASTALRSANTNSADYRIRDEVLAERFDRTTCALGRAFVSDRRRATCPR